MAADKINECTCFETWRQASKTTSQGTPTVAYAALGTTCRYCLIKAHNRLLGAERHSNLGCMAQGCPAAATRVQVGVHTYLSTKAKHALGSNEYTNSCSMASKAHSSTGEPRMQQAGRSEQCSSKGRLIKACVKHMFAVLLLMMYTNSNNSTSTDAAIMYYGTPTAA